MGHLDWPRSRSLEKCYRVLISPVEVEVEVEVEVNMPDHNEITDDVHVHDPMHNSGLIHVISCYLHSFSCQLVCLVNYLCYYVHVT